MNHAEKRIYLIRRLLEERPQDRDLALPADSETQKQLLRGLLNLRLPAPVDEDFLQVQDDYLRENLEARGITDAAALPRLRPWISLWQGDITTLKCDAIVNAANSGMTGCYQPCHNCIDNCIHTYAGVQLRLACAALMERQGHEEPTGTAKITPAFNLPCRYVLHTVGPIVAGRLTARHRALLAACYRSCLDLAAARGCESVAFCCISTGVFGYPQGEAAKTAVETVEAWLAGAEKPIHVIFNVFKDEDLAIYRALL